MIKAKINTISNSTNLIEGVERANIMFPNETRFIIDNVLFSTKSMRNLPSFKDIRFNGYHIEIANNNGIKYIYIILNIYTGKQMLEKLLVLSSGLYYISISTIKVNAIMNQKFNELNNFIIWYDQLGHPKSITMRRIIDNTHGYPLKNHKILQFKEFSCPTCSQGKLMSYVSIKKRWNQNEIITDNIFSYSISFDIINENKDLEPKFIEECQHRND